MNDEDGNNGFIIANIESINKTKKMMDDYYNDLINILNKCQNLIEDSVAIYDTESATLFRKVGLSYIELMRKYINDDLKVYIDKLEFAQNTYLEEVNETSQTIGGGA